MFILAKISIQHKHQVLQSYLDYGGSVPAEFPVPVAHPEILPEPSRRNLQLIYYKGCENMFPTPNNSSQFDSLSDEDKAMLARINAYAEQVLGDIDPQKTRISYQLDKLRPIMQEIADEKGISLEDVFIKYMDISSVVLAKQDAMLKEDLDDMGLTDFTAR